VTLSLRPATLEDLPALLFIDAPADAAALPAARYRELLRSPQAALVLLAEEAGQPAGLSASSRVIDEATVLAIAVHPSRRRRGIGRALLAATLTGHAEAGASRCLLEVRASNAAARSLYRGAGFVEDGVRRGYYPARGDLAAEDAILMSRRLEPVRARTGN
jgi:ribosomal-protein-alanine N-acetyltransferase